jgi:NADPH-dependent 2,4-dienoyl-CoA reductase/sulfur reductase-like enzyme
LASFEGFEGVHYLRTLDDCLALRAALSASPRVVVVGAGFIGAEVASTCRGLGLDVTVLEALPVPLGRAVGAEMGAVLAELHRDNGVDLRLSAAVEGLVGDGKVEAVRLADGVLLPADVVVVGVGVTPATGWLEGCGLEIRDGIVCDESCAAGPDVVAAGDVARWRNPLFATELRVEHWDNAVAQAEAAARRLLEGADGAVAYAPVPYFWSDQYGTKIQFVGTTAPGDSLEVVEGSTSERRFVAAYRRQGTLVGALLVGSPHRMPAYRRMVAERDQSGSPP